MLYNPFAMSLRREIHSFILLSSVFILAACNFEPGPGLSGRTPPAGAETQAATPEGPTSTPTAVPSPTPIPRQLTICLGEEPETLFIYGGASLAQSHVLEAVYDGPIDTAGYEDQPVILEKLPDMADGSAALEPVAIQAGDLVVDDSGQPVSLAAGSRVRPAGCTSTDCAITWDGSSPLEMDRLVATFTLKPDLRWSDGATLTIADSVFSYEVARNCQGEQGACGGLGLVTRQGFETVEHTASYTALDERTVQWSGLPGFLDPNYQLNFFIPLPEHQLAQIPPEQLFTAEQTARRPIGWGAYTIEEWIPGQYLQLRKNPNYWRAAEGLPRYDLLTFRFLLASGDASADAERNRQVLESGACDVLDQQASLSLQAGGLQALFEAEAGGQMAVHAVPGTSWEHVDFGIRPLSYDDGYQPAFDRPDLFGDPRVRQALALCMDRQKVVDTVLSGRVPVMDTYLLPDHPLFNPEAPTYVYDPEAGAALLQQAGWIDHDGDPQTPRQSQGALTVQGGTPLQFTYLASNHPQRQQAAEILAASLAECGVQVDLQILDAEQVYAPGPDGPVFGRTFDMAQFAWQGSRESPCALWTSEQIPGEASMRDEDGTPRFPRGWGGANETGYSDPEFDRQCQAALQSLPGKPGYVENHLQAQATFAADLPVVPLYQHLKIAITRPDLCGFQLDPTAFSEMWTIEAFDAGGGCGD